jgi:hypothetical protein
MKRKLWSGLFFAAVIAFCFLAQVTVHAANIDPAVGEYVDGKYTNKAPAFSVQLPKTWVAQKPWPGETYRIANPNEWLIPVSTLIITDKAKDAPALGSDAAGEAYLKLLKDTNEGSSRHRIESKEMVNLSDGTPAMALIVKWRFKDGQTTLVTAVLVAYKDDKIINLTNTTVAGGAPPPEILLAIIKTLTFK